DRQVTLCASGDFSLRETRGTGGLIELVDSRQGTWQVRIADGATALALDDDAPIPLARDASGALLIDGQATDLQDADAQCNADVVTPPPPDDAAEREALIALVRAVTDRTIVIAAPDGDVDQQRELRLCGSGRSTDTTESDAGVVSTQTEGTWTI